MEMIIPPSHDPSLFLRPTIPRGTPSPDAPRPPRRTQSVRGQRKSILDQIHSEDRNNEQEKKFYGNDYSSIPRSLVIPPSHDPLLFLRPTIPRGTPSPDAPRPPEGRRASEDRGNLFLDQIHSEDRNNEQEKKFYGNDYSSIPRSLVIPPSHDPSWDAFPGRSASPRRTQSVRGQRKSILDQIHSEDRNNE